MIQTVQVVQEMLAKALLVDMEALRVAREQGDVVDAERCLADAFATDVRPMVLEWRSRRGLPADPIRDHRESGYVVRAASDRLSRKSSAGGSYA